MSALFLGALLLGLLLGVFSMLHGVERDGPASPARAPGSAPDQAASEPSASLKLPLIAAFASVFGLAGYLVARYTTLPVPAELGVATTLGALGALGAAALVLKWAIPSARADVVDERYLLQGHPARVVEAITASAPGTIEYEVEGKRVVHAACSFDGAAIAPGTDVVIDRVEEGVAYVEMWALVEARL
jgi:hypothetical protein